MSIDIIYAFQNAARTDDMDEMRALCEKHPSWVNIVDILEIAASKCYMGMLRYLLPLVTNQEHRNNAIREAATYGQLEAVEFLLPYVPNKGRLAFAVTNAAAKGHPEVVKLLSDKVDLEVLVLAMKHANQNGHADVAEYLQDKINSMTQSAEVGASGDSQPMKPTESQTSGASQPANNNQDGEIKYESRKLSISLKDAIDMRDPKGIKNSLNKIPSQVKDPLSLITTDPLSLINTISNAIIRNKIQLADVLNSGIEDNAFLDKLFLILLQEYLIEGFDKKRIEEIVKKIRNQDMIDSVLLHLVEEGYEDFILDILMKPRSSLDMPIRVKYAPKVQTILTDNVAAHKPDMDFISELDSFVDYAKKGAITELKSRYPQIEGHRLRDYVRPTGMHVYKPYDYDVPGRYNIALEEAIINNRREAVQFLLSITIGRRKSKEAKAEMESILSYHFSNLDENGYRDIAPILEPYVKSLEVVAKKHLEMNNAPRIVSILHKMTPEQAGEAMIFAIRNRQKEGVKVLLPVLNNPAMLHSSFLLSISLRHFDIVQEILPKIQDPKAFAYGLKLSAEHNYKEIMEALLPKVKNKAAVGEAIGIAADPRRTEALNYLLGKVTDQETLNSAFLFAVKSGKLDTVKALRGAVGDQKTFRSALDLASNDNADIKEFLRASIEDIKKIEDEFDVAIMGSNIDLIERILPNIKDQDIINDAFAKALESGDKEIVAALYSRQSYLNVSTLADNYDMIPTIAMQSFKSIPQTAEEYFNSFEKNYFRSDHKSDPYAAILSDPNNIYSMMNNVRNFDFSSPYAANSFLGSGEPNLRGGGKSQLNTQDVLATAALTASMLYIFRAATKGYATPVEEERRESSTKKSTKKKKAIEPKTSEPLSVYDITSATEWQDGASSSLDDNKSATKWSDGASSSLGDKNIWNDDNNKSDDPRNMVKEVSEDGIWRPSNNIETIIDDIESSVRNVSSEQSYFSVENMETTPDSIIYPQEDKEVKQPASESELFTLYRTDPKALSQALSQKRADINQLDNRGFSLLHYACLDCNVELIKDLIRNGANVGIVSSNNLYLTMPSMIAISGHHEDSVKALEALNLKNISHGPLMFSMKFDNDKLAEAVSDGKYYKNGDVPLNLILYIATSTDDQDLIKKTVLLMKKRGGAINPYVLREGQRRIYFIDRAINGNGIGLQGLIESGVTEINADLVNKAVLDGNPVTLNKILELNSKREVPVDLKIKMEGENNILYLVYKKRLEIARENEGLNEKYLVADTDDREKIANQMASNLDRINKMYDSVNVLLERGLIDLNAASKFNISEIDQKHFLIETYKELSTYRKALKDGFEFKDLNQSNVARLEKTLSNLLAKGVNTRVVDEYGQNIAMLAAQDGDMEALKLYTGKANNQVSDLLKDRDRMGNTALFHAAEFEAKYVFDFLIQQGAEFRDENGALIRNNKGTTPLMLLAKNGYMNASDKFVVSEKDVIDVDNRGNTPMHYLAMGSGGTEVPYILNSFIIKGANINARNVDGATPLMQAIINGNSGLVKDLISKGADVNMPDKYGNTPLICACLLNNKDIINAVLSSPLVDINKGNNRGISPYLIASQRDALQKLNRDNLSDDTKELLKKWEPNSYEGLSNALILKGAAPSEIDFQSVYNRLMATTHEITAFKFLSEANNVIISPDPKFRNLSSDLVTQVANLFGAKITYNKVSKEFADDVILPLRSQLIFNKENLKNEIMVGSFSNEGIGSVKYGQALGDGLITTPEALVNAAYGKDRNWLLKASEVLSEQYLTLQKNIESQPWYYRILMPWKRSALNKASENVLQAHGVIALAIKDKVNKTEDFFEAKYSEKGGLIDLVSQSPKKLMDKILYSSFDTEDREISRANELINSVVQKEIASSPKTFYMFAKFAAERDKLLNSSDAKKESFIKGYKPSKDQLILNVDGKSEISPIKNNAKEVNPDVPSYKGKSSVTSSLNWLFSKDSPYKTIEAKEAASALSNIQYKDVGIFSEQLEKDAFSSLQKGVRPMESYTSFDLKSTWDALQNIISSIPRIKIDDYQPSIIKEPIEESKQHVPKSDTYLSTSNPITEVVNNPDISVKSGKVVEEKIKKDVQESEKEEGKNKDGQNISTVG